MCKLKTMAGRERDQLDTVPPKVTARITRSMGEEPFVDVPETNP
jgi:hypothetical protein